MKFEKLAHFQSELTFLVKCSPGFGAHCDNDSLSQQIFRLYEELAYFQYDHF